MFDINFISFDEVVEGFEIDEIEVDTPFIVELAQDIEHTLKCHAGIDGKLIDILKGEDGVLWIWYYNKDYDIKLNFDKTADIEQEEIEELKFLLRKYL